MGLSMIISFPESPGRRTDAARCGVSALASGEAVADVPPRLRPGPGN